MTRRRLLPVLVLSLPVLAPVPASAAPSAATPAGSCEAAAAITRNDTLGAPRDAVPTPDGRSVLYLRSGPRDTALALYRFDPATRQETVLAAPETGQEHLSVAEKARRERARMTLSGITDFALSPDGHTVLVSEADRLSVVSLPGGETREVTGRGWIAPRLSPDGRFVAAVRDDDLHVVDLASGTEHAITSGGTDTLTHGLPEFAASEELDRADGTWWSPDSRTLLYEESDTSGVEPHFIADPAHPERAPVMFRYPRAGTANARVRLFLVARDGGTPRPVAWDSVAYPYLVRVVWPKGHAPLTLVVMNRPETEQRLLAVDPGTGSVRTLLDETDPAFIDTSPVLGLASAPLPRWLADGSGFFWASDRTGPWRLELHRADGTLDRVLTPPGLSFVSLDDVDLAHGTATVTAAPDSLDVALYRIGFRDATAAPRAIASEPGIHAARFADGAHGILVDRFRGADGRAASLVRDASDGHVVATLPSRAETPPPLHVAFTRAGPLGFDAAIVRPDDIRRGVRYPVVLAVYGGPEVKLVQRDPRLFIEDQCLADHGFVVVSLDGRGTPLRGHDWERAIKGDLLDVPLDDQVAGLQALGARYPELDLARVGITGWSFGGFLTAAATMRRPDVFKVGVAGAPPTDWSQYDTAYTERYLGTPDSDPDGYRTSSAITYAGQLRRPLLLIHGQTDDNVYFVNTSLLTDALLRAGRPYDLLLLPGTHLLSDPVLRARVDEARADFLAAHLLPEVGKPSGSRGRAP